MIVDQLIFELSFGRVRSVAFVVPSDVTVTTPLYDVAIATARRGWRLGLEDIHYWFVTPEQQPVSLAAAERLEPEGITFVGSTYSEVRHGLVLLDPQGESIEVDLVVSLGDSGGLEVIPDRRRLVPARFARHARSARRDGRERAAELLPGAHA
jgi:hypothetical protein